MMKKLLPAIITLIAFSAPAYSLEQKLFTMEKNYNAENIMIIHTQTDSNCKFVTSSKNNESNYIEFYWLMNNGRSTKEVHSLIRSEIKDRVVFKGVSARKDSFKMKLSDLSEVRHDLSDTTMEAVSEMINGECIVKSIITLGASSRYKKIDLNRTYCEVTKNFVGIPNGCKFLELEGSEIETGRNVKVRFYKR